MPYIITTQYPIRPLGASGIPFDTRTAVATPDEVRDHVHGLGADYDAMAHLDCVLDGTSRMPIGPLPDGTVIEVRLVGWIEAMRLAGTNGGTHEHILAALNSR